MTRDALRRLLIQAGVPPDDLEPDRVDCALRFAPNCPGRVDPAEALQAGEDVWICVPCATHPDRPRSAEERYIAEHFEELTDLSQWEHTETVITLPDPPGRSEPCH